MKIKRVSCSIEALSHGKVAVWLGPADRVGVGNAVWRSQNLAPQLGEFGKRIPNHEALRQPVARSIQGQGS